MEGGGGGCNSRSHNLTHFTIGHVRYINILTRPAGFQDKIANF